MNARGDVQQWRMVGRGVAWVQAGGEVQQEQQGVVVVPAGRVKRTGGLEV